MASSFVLGAASSVHARFSYNNPAFIFTQIKFTNVIIKLTSTTTRTQTRTGTRTGTRTIPRKRSHDEHDCQCHEHNCHKSIESDRDGENEEDDDENGDNHNYNGNDAVTVSDIDSDVDDDNDDEEVQYDKLAFFSQPRKDHQSTLIGSIPLSTIVGIGSSCHLDLASTLVLSRKHADQNQNQNHHNRTPYYVKMNEHVTSIEFALLIFIITASVLNLTLIATMSTCILIYHFIRNMHRDMRKKKLMTNLQQHIDESAIIVLEFDPSYLHHLVNIRKFFSQSNNHNAKKYNRNTVIQNKTQNHTKNENRNHDNSNSNGGRSRSSGSRSCSSSSSSSSSNSSSSDGSRGNSSFLSSVAVNRSRSKNVNVASSNLNLNLNRRIISVPGLQLKNNNNTDDDDDDDNHNLNYESRCRSSSCRPSTSPARFRSRSRSRSLALLLLPVSRFVSVAPLFLDNMWFEYLCVFLLPRVIFNSTYVRNLVRLVLPLLYLYQAIILLARSIIPTTIDVFFFILPHYTFELSLLFSLFLPIINHLDFLRALLTPSVLSLASSLSSMFLTISSFLLSFSLSLFSPLLFLFSSLFDAGRAILHHTGWALLFGHLTGVRLALDSIARLTKPTMNVVKTMINILVANGGVWMLYVKKWKDVLMKPVLTLIAVSKTTSNFCSRFFASFYMQSFSKYVSSLFSLASSAKSAASVSATASASAASATASSSSFRSFRSLFSSLSSLYSNFVCSLSRFRFCSWSSVVRIVNDASQFVIRVSHLFVHTQIQKTIAQTKIENDNENENENENFSQVNGKEVRTLMTDKITR